MERGQAARTRAPRLIVAAAVPILAVAISFVMTDGGGHLASTRVAVPAPTLEGDPLVAAENLRALLETDAVLDRVASTLGVARRDLRNRLGARQIGRGSVVEVTYEGGQKASTGAPAAAVIAGLTATFGPELADRDEAVAARARARLDVVEGEARRATTVRPSDRRLTATAGAGAIGLVLAVAGLVLSERAR